MECFEGDGTEKKGRVVKKVADDVSGVVGS